MTANGDSSTGTDDALASVGCREYSYDLADERAYSNAKGSGSDEGSGEKGAVGSVERGCWPIRNRSSCWLGSPLLTGAPSCFSRCTLWCLIGTSYRAYARIARYKLASARAARGVIG